MPNAALGELREMGGLEFVQDLVETFATNVSSCLARVQAGAQGGDTGDAAKAAHSIAGGAGQLGATGLETLAREMEIALRGAGTPAGGGSTSGSAIDDGHLAALVAEADRAIAALRAASRE